MKAGRNEDSWNASSSYHGPSKRYGRIYHDQLRLVSSASFDKWEKRNTAVLVSCDPMKVHVPKLLEAQLSGLVEIDYFSLRTNENIDRVRFQRLINQRMG